MDKRERIINVILLLFAVMPNVKAQQTTLSRDVAEQIRDQIVAEWLSNQIGLLKKNDETNCITQNDLHMR